jgi:hypothetical protein
MIVTAWNNSEHHVTGPGYGVKIQSSDIDKFFSPEWDYILLNLEGESEPVEVNTNKNSFWSGSCGELINKRIGQWLFNNKLAPWEIRNPPKLNLEPIKDNEFILKRPLLN